VPAVQREIFAAQLELAAETRRPVVLHGAKCWGEVVKMIRPYASRIPAFLFHGFSRSDGLMPDIVAMNGFVGVGKAVLNDHAVNYMEMVKRLPSDRILIETDYDGESEDERTAILTAITARVSELTLIAETQFVANATSFLEKLSSGPNVGMV
jgi:Tat protein secretion system quality control protein TatD with DNase activity